jgi:hypothetical protein
VLQAAQLETLSGAFARQGAECERLQEQLEGSNGALVGLTAEVNCLKAQLQEGARREIEQKVRLPASACQLQQSAAGLPGYTQCTPAAAMCATRALLGTTPSGTQCTIYWHHHVPACTM